MSFLVEYLILFIRPLEAFVFSHIFSLSQLNTISPQSSIQTNHYKQNDISPFKSQQSHTINFLNMSEDMYDDPPPPYSAVDPSASSGASHEFRATILPPSQGNPRLSNVLNSFQNILSQHFRRQTTRATTVRRIPKCTFCNSCKLAQKSWGYDERLRTLFQELFCSACNKPHINTFFSQQQESQPDTSRRCIAHEGYVSVCPHLRITYAQLKSAAERDDEVVLQCSERACLHRNTTVAMSRVDARRYQMQMRWEGYKVLGELRTEVDDNDLKEVFQEGLCLHYMMQPSGLYSTTDYNRHPDDPWRLYRWCKLCFMCCAYYYLRTAPDGRLRMYFGVERYYVLQKNEDINDYEWCDSMDPNSFGLFTDGKWKDVAWCGDQRCSTTRVLARYRALIRLGKPSCEMVGETDAQKILEILNVFTSGNFRGLE